MESPTVALARPEWIASMGKTSWYHFICTRTNKSKCMSSFSTVPLADGRHTWTVTHDPHPSWRHVRCPECGHIAERGADIPDPLPHWCGACGTADVVGWLPVERQPYLTVTWLHFECDRCSALTMVGNDASPVFCLGCLANTARGCQLRPKAVLAPNRVHWTPRLHPFFPPSFRRALRCFAAVSAPLWSDAWLPEELFNEVAAFLPVATVRTKSEWIAPAAENRRNLARWDTNGREAEDDETEELREISDARPRSRRRLDFALFDPNSTARPSTPQAA
eukprot:TRINITY_DN1413_c0_g1_i1.p1 TRINITY_DN1413_c0_g1~~TRINITY_DN1413_c0_g1_i1.p1  ORF type:complete len:278 (-),score=22.12 TRINITY_DN1413_c0_g1_i1:86-919(-)